MERYIGTKIVLAEPMDAVTFSDQIKPLVGTTLIRFGKPVEGYKVMYEDGYISWSPKEIFERAYRQITKQEIDLLTLHDIANDKD